MTIKRNAVHCLDCDEVIESKHRHDFRYCKGQHVFVDGGLSYLRRGWKDDARFEDISEVSPDEEEQ